MYVFMYVCMLYIVIYKWKRLNLISYANNKRKVTLKHTLNLLKVNQQQHQHKKRRYTQEKTQQAT